jgi:radical SAM-linked protein
MPERHRIRLRYRKEETRFLGHLDLIRTLERTFRRAELPLAMSAGFHPKPRMTFIAPLPVGCAGAGEVMEVELSRPCDTGQVLEALCRHAPPGLVFLSADPVPAGAAKPRLAHAVYQTHVPEPLRDGLEDRIDRFLKLSHYPVERSGRNQPFDIRRHVTDVRFAENLLTITLTVSDRGGARLREVLTALGLADLEQHGGVLTRAAVELAPAPEPCAAPKTKTHQEKEST